MQKKIVTISLWITSSIVAGIFLNLITNKNNFPNSIATNNQTSTSTLTQTVRNSNPGITLSIQEVAKHNTASNCWLIISNKVYDATNYISAHPGGANAIISYCGQDATAPFAQIHSQRAYNILGGLLVGNLNETIQGSTQGNSQQTQTNTNTQTNPTPQNQRFEVED